MGYRRPLLAILFLSVIGSLLVPSATLAARSSQSAALDTSVLRALNLIRVQHGLAALTVSPQLNAAAAAHTREMVSDGYFGHASPNGLAFWQRIANFYPSSSYAFWSVGENLLWSTGQIDASAAIATWMASPMHRANILSAQWRQIGIGALNSEDAPGTYAGLPVTVITTDFGVRR